MPAYENIEITTKNRVATLAMNRPSKLNAFDVVTLHEMRDAVESINGDDEIRVAILTSTGRAFSAGADLKSSDAAQQNVVEHLENDYRPVLMAIREAPKPWISAVRGAAAGIGSAFAMNCDLTIMSENAYIYQAFAAIGLVPDGGATWHLVRTVGRKRAYELIATGEKLSAAKCLEYGLCNRVVPDESLASEAQRWAEELTAKAPLSLRYAKEAVRVAGDSDLGETFSAEAQLQRLCVESEDAKEAIRAFFQKRQPEFKGR